MEQLYETGGAHHSAAVDRSLCCRCQRETRDGVRRYVIVELIAYGTLKKENLAFFGIHILYVLVFDLKCYHCNIKNLG